jgi:hypothetical protein
MASARTRLAPIPPFCVGTQYDADMTLATTDLAYMAGVVDSDGYIGVHRNTYAMRVRGDATAAVYQPRVQVKQVELGAIDLLAETFGGHRYVAPATATKGRPLHGWTVHSAACRPVLEALRPYLRIKHRQADNALEVCRINSSAERRRFVVPPVIDGEPMVSLADAARRLGKSYGTAHQCVKLGNIPFMREGRRIFVPESYLDTWANRRKSPVRRPDITEALEERFQRAKTLNRVGV